MRAQQIRKFDMLRRVQQFLDEFAVELFAVNAAAARKQLDQLVEEMGVNETAQASNTLSAKSQTASQAVLRRDLLNHHMRPVATIAAAHLRDVPGFKALQLPKVGVKAAVLVQDATAMAGSESVSAGVRGERPCGELRRRAVGRGGGSACVDRRARQEHREQGGVAAGPRVGAAAPALAPRPSFTYFRA